ncbi:hypothetical protein [Kitasatospora sp. NPDC093679]|uniref:hypothetical protein n=1 Tax=Kitasatospora sp. NPDC093679 TaxID=3154983 RepID=UPI003427130E
MHRTTGLGWIEETAGGLHPSHRELPSTPAGNPPTTSFVLFGVAVHVARVRQALVFLAGLQLAFAGLLLALTLVLMPRYGLTGVGTAWLATASVLALVLAATAPRWLTARPHRT